MPGSNRIIKPNILMIAPEPFFESRGTPISVYQRIHALSQLGYHVDLLTYFLGKEVNIPGVRIFRTPKFPFIKEIPIGPSWKKILLDIAIFLQALVLLSKNGYQIIHSHEEASHIALLLTALFRIRHVYDMHSSLPIQIRQTNYRRITPLIAYFRLVERLVINKADAVITIGADLDEYIRTIKPEVNSIIIDNLPLQSISPVTQPAANYLRELLNIDCKVPVVYTGSFERYQGIDILISSAKIILSQNPNIVFILIGGNRAQIKKYKSKVQQEHLLNSFIFKGRVSAADSLDYINLADILVSPRISGMSVPLKIYSYLNSGKAIVATNIEAHTKILSADIALLTEPTAAGIAEGILKIVNNPEFGKELGLQAKLFAIEKFSYANYLAKVAEIYQTILPITGSAPLLENLTFKG